MGSRALNSVPHFCKALTLLPSPGHREIQSSALLLCVFRLLGVSPLTCKSFLGFSHSHRAQWHQQMG